uniref:Uncharacterized protein n=1 Tax=Caenorhabditis japonica TaxID=281687 RepID=A0A8R1IA36_CAEJA
MIVMKFSLMAYQKLRERLVINALKTINPTLKQADDEDQLKRRSSITKIFRISRKQRRPPREDSSSEYTNSTQKLLKSNQKNKTKKNC